MQESRCAQGQTRKTWGGEMMKLKKGNLVVLGLSDENMKRLSKGEPIKFNLQSLEMPNIDIFIFNGRTEESMFEMVDQFIDINKTKFK